MIDLPGQQQAGGVAATGDAQATAGLVEMAVNRVLGNAETTRDLLGVQVFGDQAEALSLARSEPFYRHRVVTVPHKRGGKCSQRLSSIPLVKSVSIRRPRFGRDAVAEWGSSACLAHPKMTRSVHPSVERRQPAQGQAEQKQPYAFKRHGGRNLGEPGDEPGLGTALRPDWPPERQQIVRAVVAALDPRPGERLGGDVPAVQSPGHGPAPKILPTVVPMIGLIEMNGAKRVVEPAVGHDVATAHGSARRTTRHASALGATDKEDLGPKWPGLMGNVPVHATAIPRLLRNGVTRHISGRNTSPPRRGMSP